VALFSLIFVSTRPQEVSLKKYDIGLIGMGVMGQNLTLNINDHGFSVVVFN